MTDILSRLHDGLATGSAEETRAVAGELAAAVPADAAIALHGDLGVGKTTFVQGLALAFGIAEPVVSPTFTLCRLYRPSRPGGRNLAHLDAYRLERPEQVEALLLDEFLASPYCLAVEWPDRVAAWMPPDAWHLELGIASDRRHTIRLRAPSAA